MAGAMRYQVPPNTMPGARPHLVVNAFAPLAVFFLASDIWGYALIILNAWAMQSPDRARQTVVVLLAYAVSVALPTLSVVLHAAGYELMARIGLSARLLPYLYAAMYAADRQQLLSKQLLGGWDLKRNAIIVVGIVLIDIALIRMLFSGHVVTRILFGIY